MDKNNFISLTSKDKTIMKGIHYIEDICTRLNIMDGTTKKACEILKKVDEMELVKGQKLNTKCGTIIFIACRMTKNNTNVRDIFKATNMGHKELSKCFKRLKPAIPGQ
jgi:transcription initiation factor TFIIIB Brf1 subunit/transcription initiation factor TFIIB